MNWAILDFSLKFSLDINCQSLIPSIQITIDNWILLKAKYDRGDVCKANRREEKGGGKTGR